MSTEEQSGDGPGYHHAGGNPLSHTHHDEEIFSEEVLRSYWRANLSLLIKLLSIWFVVSYGCGILLVDWLDQFQFFGFKLGFWFAQQGAIYIFVVLIFVYAWRIKVIEREYGVDDDTDGKEEGE